MKYYYRKKILVAFSYLFDGFGKVIFFLRKKRKMSKEIRNILIIRLDHLGDVLYLTPSLNSIKKQYPSARITLLVASWAKRLVEDNPNLDEVIIYDAPWFKRGKKKLEIFKLFRLIVELRRRNFDLAIDFKGYLWHIFMLYLSGAKFTVGLKDVGGGFLLDRSLDRRCDLHAVLQNIEILRSIGIKNKEKPVVEVGIEKHDVLSVDKTLNSYGLNSQRIIAIHCGAGRESKRWPIERFSNLILRIIEKLPEYVVVLVGGEEERELIQTISIESSKVIALLGKFNLIELAEFLRRCSLFIGNDSAPAHFAAVMKVPTIVLFSCEDDPVQWKPWGEKVIVLQKEQYEFKPLSQHEILSSLDKITVDDVFDAIGGVIK